MSGLNPGVYFIHLGWVVSHKRNLRRKMLHGEGALIHPDLPASGLGTAKGSVRALPVTESLGRNSDVE